MLKFINFSKIIATFVFFVLCLTAHAKPVNNLIYFGCSFTSQEDALKKWPDYLSGRYGKQARKNIENFAISGASSTVLPEERLTYYLTHPVIDDSTIYLTYMGPNDLSSELFFQVVQIDTRLEVDLEVDRNNIKYYISRRTENIVQHIRDLIAHGGKNFIVLNHLNENYRCRGKGVGGFSKTEFNAHCILWNKILTEKIDALKKEYANKSDINITLLDYFGFTTDMGMHPSYLSSTDYNAYYGGDKGDHPCMYGHMFTSDWISTQLDKLGWDQQRP